MSTLGTNGVESLGILKGGEVSELLLSQVLGTDQASQDFGATRLRQILDVEHPFGAAELAQVASYGVNQVSCHSF